MIMGGRTRCVVCCMVDGAGQHTSQVSRARVEDRWFRSYDITHGEPVAFRDFVRKVGAKLGFPPIEYRAPKSLAYAIAALEEGIERTCRPLDATGAV